MGAILSSAIAYVYYGADPEADDPLYEDNNSDVEGFPLPEHKMNNLERTIKIRTMFSSNAVRGVVSKDAVSSLLLKLGIRDIGIHDYICRYYDTDHNGEFSYTEFFQLMVSVASIHKDFMEADKNHDNELSSNEIRFVLERLSMPLEDKAIDLLMYIFDINDDKVLNYGEFFLLYIFLTELRKVFANFKTTLRIKVNQLCKLLENPEEEAAAAAELNRIFGLHAFPLTLDNFTRVVAQYKHKVKPCKTRPRPNSCHNHPELRKLDSRIEGPWHDNFDKAIPHNLRDKVVWRRVSEIHSKGQLFVDDIDESDVIQGDLQNCWFLGALAVVAASDPDAIRNLFVAENREKGFYRCQFYKNAKWETIDVDDRLPCFTITSDQAQKLDNPILYFASCQNKSEFWVPILEKAYAKLHGSYSALEHGDIAEALKDLTGGATQTFDITNERHELDSQWQRMISFANQKCLMGCAIDRKEDTSGLLARHAYSILKCQEVDGIRFVRLRNPWGKKEWNGDWSDESTKWTAEWRAKDFVEGYAFIDDGKFHMCFEDFVKYFDHLYVLRTPYGDVKRFAQGKWDRGNAKGCHQHHSWYCNPRYTIRTTEPNSTVLVNLTQYDQRQRYGINPVESRTRGTNNHIGMYLLEKNDGNNQSLQFHQLVKTTEFTDARDASLEYESKSPGTSILIPCTHLPKQSGNYTISVYSNKHVELEEIKHGKAHKLLGEWTQGFQSVTGSMKPKGMRTEPVHGPMSLLVCSHAGSVDILLSPKGHSTCTKNACLSIGIKVYESIPGSANYNCVLRLRTIAPSMCVTLTVKENLEYIIEPIAYMPVEENTKFKVVVFSNHVAKFYAFAAHSHGEDGSCTLSAYEN